MTKAWQKNKVFCSHWQWQNFIIFTKIKSPICFRRERCIMFWSCKSPTSLRWDLWDVKFNEHISQARLQSARATRGRCLSLALVPRAVDSEWFNRARQHRFTVRRGAASLKRVPGISYRKAEARRVRGGARDTPLSRAGVWGKSLSCLNAFLKFQNRVKSNIMSSMTG